MSRLTEKIRLKFDSLENNNFYENEDEESILYDIEYHSNKELEDLYKKSFDINSEFSYTEKEESIHKFLDDKVIPFSCYMENSIENSQNEKLDKNNNKIYQYDLLNHINNFDSNCKNIRNFIPFNEKKYQLSSDKMRIYSNNFSNYSTDLTKNFESNKKLQGYNYCEFDNLDNEKIINNDNFETSIFRSNLELILEEDKKAFYISSINSNKKSNESKNYVKMELNNLIENGTEKDFSDISNKGVIEHNIISEDLVFKSYPNQSSESENFYYQKICEEIKTTEIFKSPLQTKYTDFSDNKILFTFFSFFQKVFIILIFIILLVLDPLIILILKIINCIKNQAKEFKKEKYSKIQNNINNHNSKHLMICEEIDSLSLKSYIDEDSSLYKSYIKIFLENCFYKKITYFIKIFFIIILFILSFIIIVTVKEKSTKVLLFFLNNLYLLYHISDIYNENLVSYSENLKWSNILERI